MTRPPSWMPCLVAVSLATPLQAQEPVPASVELGVDTLRMEVGDTARVPIRILDAAGAVVDVQPFLIARAPRGAVIATREGQVIARLAGTWDVRVAVPNAPAARGDFTVVVRPSPVTAVAIGPDRERLYVGTTTMLDPVATDRRGTERTGIEVAWRSSDPAVASVDRFGQVQAHRPGRVTVSTEVEGVRGQRTFTVVENPVRTVLVELSADAARTGDVIHATARVLDARGRPVPDAPVSWSLIAEPVDSVIAASPAAEIDARGRFVAQKAGRYTILGEAAGRTARAMVMVTERDVAQQVRLVGHGAVRHVHSSDLWVWEGADGRDYAITGTWGGNGVAYFWDVTDPASQQLIDSVTVDARTVNDVKVSEDGGVCVISREGASDRRNGLVILDCSNPRDVSILSTFDDDMTGGVHNVFVYRNHIYAVNNGRKYDIINIEDPRTPRRVGVFELTTPGHAIHDVWVVDGIRSSLQRFGTDGVLKAVYYTQNDHGRLGFLEIRGLVSMTADPRSGDVFLLSKVDSKVVRTSPQPATALRQ